MAKYSDHSESSPAVAALALFLSGGIAAAALTVEEAPTLVLVILWAIAVLLVLVMLGSLISSSVEVDEAGSFTMAKALGGLRIARVDLPAGAVKAIELQRTMTPGSGHADGGSENPDTARYRLDVIHRQGVCLVEAGAKYGSISTRASRLAEALSCPLQKTGDWNS